MVEFNQIKGRGEKNTDSGCLKTGCREEYSDLRVRMCQEPRGYYIMNSFIICIHQTLLEP
jgi:hypothetical protein